jgi:hypothetical protein
LPVCRGGAHHGKLGERPVLLVVSARPRDAARPMAAMARWWVLTHVSRAAQSRLAPARGHR